MRVQPIVAAVLLAASALATPLAHAQAGATASCQGVADSTCLGGSRGSRPTTGTQTLGAAAAMARAGCTQGMADSTCAVPNGSPMGGYADLNAAPTIACRNLAPSTWPGACPAGKIGSITFRSDYACGYQTVYQTGSLVPVKVYAEPGQYGPAYVAADNCVDPPPPPAPTPPAKTVTFYLAAGGLAYGGPVSVPAGYPYAFAYYSGYGFGGSTYEFVVFTNVPMSDLEANGRAGVYALGSGMIGAMKPGQSYTNNGWTINHASNSQTYYPTVQGSGSIGSLFLNGGTNGPGTCFDWLYTESHHVCNNGSTVQ